MARTLCGLPTRFEKNDPEPAPNRWIGLPKPILKAQRTQATSTTAKVMKVSIMLFTDQALLHHAAVEHDETGDAHQADERGGGHLPRVVA